MREDERDRAGSCGARCYDLSGTPSALRRAAAADISKYIKLTVSRARAPEDLRAGREIICTRGPADCSGGAELVLLLVGENKSRGVAAAVNWRPAREELVYTSFDSLGNIGREPCVGWSICKIICSRMIDDIFTYHTEVKFFIPQ